MQERIKEKDNYINKAAGKQVLNGVNMRKDGSNPGNNSADNDFDEAAANEEKEALEA